VAFIPVARPEKQAKTAGSLEKLVKSNTQLRDVSVMDVGGRA